MSIFSCLACKVDWHCFKETWVGYLAKTLLYLVEKNISKFVSLRKIGSDFIYDLKPKKEKNLFLQAK